ncbi:hypothetical protein QY887_10100 [Latilactobacillus sakei]
MSLTVKAQPFLKQRLAAIDSEVRRLIDEAHQQATEIIQAHREQHKLIAEMLLKYETLNEKEILSLFNDGKMPEKNAEEFPSEKAATFEEAKKALEAKEAEKTDSELEAEQADSETTEVADDTADSKPTNDDSNDNA